LSRERYKEYIKTVRKEGRKRNIPATGDGKDVGTAGPSADAGHQIGLTTKISREPNFFKVHISVSKGDSKNASLGTNPKCIFINWAGQGSAASCTDL
jgi:hypothetical protein